MKCMVSQQCRRFVNKLTGTLSGSACLPLVLVRAPIRALSCLRLPKGPTGRAAGNSHHHTVVSDGG